MIFLLSCSYKSNIKHLQTKCNNEYDVKLKKMIYTTVDTMPEFPDGLIGFNKFILGHLRYPNQGTFQGSVTCSFIIDNNGNLIAPEIYKKAADNYTALEKEILKVLSTSPKWRPGKCGDKKVPVRVTLPLKF